MLEVCKVCGSDKVQASAWVEINTGSFIDWIDDSKVWCPECEDEVNTKLQ